MGPKKVAKPSPSTKSDTPDDPWTQELQGKTINEDDWTCNVTMLLESSPSSTFYTNLLTSYSACKTNLLRQNMKILPYSNVKQNVLFDHAPENADPSKVKPYNKLCSYLNNIFTGSHCEKNKFSLLLASFIKYKILEFKEVSLERFRLMTEYKQREKLEEEEDKNQLDEILARSKNKQPTQIKTPKANKEPRSKKDKPKTKTSSKVSQKFTTLKRGQEFLDEISIDDAPESGPQMYVILTGFLEANLPLALLALGIPLVGIIKLGTVLFTGDETSNSNQLNQILEDSRILEEDIFDPFDTSSQRNSQAGNKTIEYFWKDLYLILSNPDNDDKFENVIFREFAPELPKTKYTAPGSYIPHLSKEIYDQISHLQYNTNEIIQKRFEYLKTLNVINVEKSTGDFIDTNEYNKLLDWIPSECMSIFHILDAILLQVTKTLLNTSQSFENNDDTEEESVTLSSTNENFFDKTFDNEEHTELSSKSVSTYNEILKLENLYDLAPIIETQTLGKVDEKGIILNYGDELEIKLRLCGEGSNPVLKDRAIEVLKRFWKIHLKIDSSEDPTQHYSTFVGSRNCYDEIRSGKKLLDFDKKTGELKDLATIRDSNTSDEDNYVVDKDVFHKLCLIPCAYKHITVQDKKILFCFDNNMTKKNYEPSNCTVVNQTKFIPNTEQFKDNHFCYLEAGSDIMPQKLFRALEKYECFDIENDQDKDRYYVKFHTNRSEKTLVGSLRTAVGLRDFYDFIFPELTSLNDMGMCTSTDNQTRQSVHEKELTTKNYELWCSDVDLIDVNSLKSKSVREMKRSKDYSQQENEERLENFGGFMKDLREDKPLLDAFLFDHVKHMYFTEKIERFKFSQHFIIRIKHSSNPFNKDFITIESQISDNTFYFHILMKQRVNNIKFHILHKSGMIIYFKKNVNIQDPISEEGALGNIKTTQSTHKTRGSRKSRSTVDMTPGKNTSSSDNTTPLIHKRLSYSFSLSWPSSMHLEFVDCGTCPTYIKQWYSAPAKESKPLNEEYRCYTQAGGILKFMNDKSVIIYYANGITFTNFPISLESPSNSKDKYENSDSFEIRKTQSYEGTSASSYEENENSTTMEQQLKTSKMFRGNEKNISQSFQDLINGNIRVEHSNGVVITHTYNGDLIVDFPDGSRITSSPECEGSVVLVGDTLFHRYSSEHDSELDSIPEEFVVIGTHYLIEHPSFATISFNSFKEPSIEVQLPYRISVCVNSGDDIFIVKFKDKVELIIDRSEIKLLDGSSNDNLIESTINLSNIRTYSETFPQIERYEFLTCNVGNRLVMSLNSWGEVETDQNFFNNNFQELDNVYFIVEKDLSGYEVHPRALKDQLHHITSNDEKTVINEDNALKYSTALFIQPLKNSEWQEWSMQFQPIYCFKRPLPTTHLFSFSWLDPFKGNQEKYCIDLPKILITGMLLWVEEDTYYKKKFLENKKVYNPILKRRNYDAAVNIYKQGNQKLVSDKKETLDLIQYIFQLTIDRVHPRVETRKRLQEIGIYKKFLRWGMPCKYFNTTTGISFVVADKIISNVIEITEPEEVAKKMGFLITKEIIEKAVGFVDLERRHK